MSVARLSTFSCTEKQKEKGSCRDTGSSVVKVQDYEFKVVDLSLRTIRESQLGPFSAKQLELNKFN